MHNPPFTPSHPHPPIHTLPSIPSNSHTPIHTFRCLADCTFAVGAYGVSCNVLSCEGLPEDLNIDGLVEVIPLYYSTTPLLQSTTVLSTILFIYTTYYYKSEG